VKYRRFRAVEVLRGAVIQHPAAETDCPAAPVVDWKLDAVPEAVIGPFAVFALDRQSEFQ
jgi:hypothetical protein